MMIRITAVAAVLMAAAASAQGPSFEANTSIPVRSDLNKIVCKKDETIGTRLGTRELCLTVQQWGEIKHLSRELIEKIQNSNSGKKQ